jgi:hypothetical protein
MEDVMADPKQALAHPDPGLVEFELDQRRAKAYSESGYWPDAKSVAQALVKIEAGRSLGLTPLTAMNEVHVIEGKPSLGFGALAGLVKAHPKYDYRVLEHSDQVCRIRFYENGEPLGESPFTMADADRAGYSKRNPSYSKTPRNMLFARAISNGVAWYCPDVTMGRIYVPEELEHLTPPPDDPVGEPPSDAEDAEWKDAPPRPEDTEGTPIV